MIKHSSIADCYHMDKLTLECVYSMASIDAPPGVSEWALTGLTPVPSDLVKAPRVGESAFAMECTLEHMHDVRFPYNLPCLLMR
jgi:flavin reductase (DIM6/NTAB) family NADH-FMN oxidoreductase RutF